MGLTARASSWWASDDSLWTRAVAVDPGSFVALRNLAAAKAAEGRLEEAEALLVRAVAANPGSDTARADLESVRRALPR
jgi:Flp pilus assembly protein TadD